MQENHSKYIDPYETRTFLQTFWGNIEKLKEDAGLSLPQVAKKGGLNYSTLASAYWNRDKSIPNLRTLYKLAIAFRIYPQVLLLRDISSHMHPSAEEMDAEKRSKDELGLRLKQELKTASNVLSQNQMDNIFQHALSYIDCTKESLKRYPEKSISMMGPDEIDTAVNTFCVDTARTIDGAIHAQNMTKNMAATRAGITTSAYKGIEDCLENGAEGFRRNTGTDTILKLAQTLSISYPELFAKYIQMMRTDDFRPVFFADSLVDDENYVQRTLNLTTLLTVKQIRNLITHIRLMRHAE